MCVRAGSNLPRGDPSELLASPTPMRGTPGESVSVLPAQSTLRPMNILTDPAIRTKTDACPDARLSLAETLAALMDDRVEAFPALRPHQRHAWHAFLVQLGAMAMYGGGLSQPPSEAGEWRRLLRALTPDYPDDEPWRLVVDDITHPAFMQPPAHSADRFSDYARPRNRVDTPDELDILVTGRTHDLKSAVATDSDLDDWVFALISLQTMGGYSGAGNHGISRMNGGFASRPAFSLTPSQRPGAQAGRDIRALLEARLSIVEQYDMTDAGAGLLWTIPWDGTKPESLLLQGLHPFYIEVCRRVRLHTDTSGHLYAMRATSKAARIEAKALNGRTGDPWTPINIKEGKSLTLAAGGFTYKRAADYLLSPDWQRPPLLKLTNTEQRSPQPMWLVARAMVRGQGKTEGYHERIIRLRPKAVRAFGQGGGDPELGEIAKARVEQIASVQRILRHAVWTYAAGGKTENVSDEARALANPWANKLDDVVDPSFFSDLQDEFGADDETERQRVRNDWLHGVIDAARQILHEAQDTLPRPTIHRYRARVRADSVFEGRVRGPGGFPSLFDESEGGE